MNDQLENRPMDIAKKTNKGRPRLSISECPHVNAQHYAKGMCKDCYSQNGRQKKSTQCPHTDRVAFARGLCHKCYCTWYNESAREKRRVNRQAKRQEEKLKKLSMRRVQYNTEIGSFTNQQTTLQEILVQANH